MALTAVNLTAEPRAFSVGPYKMQLMTITAVSGDSSGTITCDKLTRVDHIAVASGLQLLGVPSYSGNVATITFTSLTIATVGGTVIAFGV